MKSYVWILLIILLAFVGVVGDFFIKIAGDGQKYIDWKFFVIGFIIYAATAIGWFFAFKHVKVADLGVFYAVSTALFLAALGVFYFKEQLNSYEIAGIVLGIASILLLSNFA